MRYFVRAMIAAFLGSGCGTEHAPIPEPFDLLNGEAPIAVHCVERKGTTAQERRRTPWKAWGCDRDSLHQLALKDPPASLILVPECANGLLHITSDNYVTTQVVPLAADGRFETQLLIDTLFLTDPAGFACATSFHLTVRGRIDCPTADAEVETDWVEAPSAGRGCPSTWPCRFGTSSRIACD